MSYVMVLVLAIALIGLGLRLWAQARAPVRDEPPRQPKATSTRTNPPAHPREPVPGSDTARDQQR